MTLTWVRKGQRYHVPYENPQRRRLNVLAATVQQADTTTLHWLPVRRYLDAVDLVSCLEQLGTLDQLAVVVLDNASFHRGPVVQAARPTLRQQGLYTLPTCPRTARS
jgi:hypothetical protein